MTDKRRKQITDEINKILSKVSDDKKENNPAAALMIMINFTLGAVWADAHPDIDVRTMAAWQSGYKEAIDKACEWLSAELDKEEERHYIHVHGFDKEHREIFLEDFRKAMKGGEKLDANNVIAWLVANICDFEYYVKLFKKDFGL